MKKENENKVLVNDLLSKNSFKIFSLLISFIFCILAVYNACKLIKINHCLNFTYILSIIIPISIYFIFISDTKKNKIICSSIFLMLVLITPFIFTKTYDYTVDGNSYHKIAIGFMKEGWNPTYESSLDWQEGKNTVQIPSSTKISKWIDHYPKATWTVAATMYSYTGNIESGKSFNLLILISTSLLAYSFFSLKFSKTKSLLFSLLISLNPIMLSQFFSYYLDGIVGLCFAIEFILLVLLDIFDRKSLVLWFLLLCDCSILSNLKFTGLLYSGILAAIFYFYWLFKYRDDFVSEFKALTIKFSAIFIISICFIGANSYIRNTIDHHNPLYPLVGKDKEDIITTMQPKSFNNKNAIQKFYVSLFSRTENVTYFNDGPKLKMPFKIYKSEIETVGSIPDVRIGGFGPFFATSFIISFACLVAGLIFMFLKKNTKIKYFIMLILSIIISFIAVKEGWWARYIPQFYYVSIAGLIILDYLFKNKVMTILQSIIIICLAINLYCFLSTYSARYDDFTHTRNEMAELNTLGKLEIDFAEEGLPLGVYYNLKDSNVDFEYVKIDQEEVVRWYYSWKVRVRLNE